MDPAAEIVLSKNRIQVLDGDGQITVDVDADTWSPALLAALSVDLGEPTVHESAGGSEDPASTSYSWGGLTLSEVHGNGSSTQVSLSSNAFPPGITGRTSAGITLQSSVDQIAALAIVPPESFEYEGIQHTLFYIEGDYVKPPLDSCLGQFVPAVAVGYDSTNSRVLSIVAPSHACAP